MAIKRMSAARTVGMSIAATVAAGLILTTCYFVISTISGLVADVATIKTQQQFYHGPWPPSYQERDKL